MKKTSWKFWLVIGFSLCIIIVFQNCAQITNHKNLNSPATSTDSLSESSPPLQESSTENQ
jgi:hypothetical protein